MTTTTTVELKTGDDLRKLSNTMICCVGRKLDRHRAGWSFSAILAEIKRQNLKGLVTFTVEDRFVSLV